MSELSELLESLKKPMPYKWRVQSFSKLKPEATLVAYIDARDVMDRLDECCTYGWQRDHRQVKENLFAGIGITLSNGNTFWRWDCGTESQTEAEKGEASDSFKRAAVNWGVGRFLYDLDILRLPANEKKENNNYPHLVDSSGKRIWDITAHCNSIAKIKPIEPDNLIGYNECLRRCIDLVASIKTGIANNDLESARASWLDISDEDKSILWRAPSKGGIFTTREIEVMKSTEFRTALDNARL